MTPAADKLTSLTGELIGSAVPIRLRAWDGSVTGPDEPPTLVLRRRRALRRLLWQPGELGFADAYIAGDLDVEGDLQVALDQVRRRLVDDGQFTGRPRLTLRAVALALRLGVIGLRPARAGTQARLSGVRHTRRRDQDAIAFHYNLSNDFYRLLLDDSMAYSCAWWAHTADGYTLADAQRDKLDLVCRKLGLKPGDTLLDMGCGWGSLAMHAAQRYQAHVTAVTLSQAQSDYVSHRLEQLGLSDRVRLVCCDFRDAPAGTFDAIASIEMGEHVGEENYPDFAAALQRRLRPCGRVLVQQMSRGASAPGGGPFIETYIAPDMHMRPLGKTICLLEDAGLEAVDVQSMREHYPRTIAAWRDTLEQQWDHVVQTVGEPTARVWRVYLAGGSLAFERGRMGVDQIVCVNPGANGSTGLVGDGAVRSR